MAVVAASEKFTKRAELRILQKLYFVTNRALPQLLPPHEKETGVAYASVLSLSVGKLIQNGRSVGSVDPLRLLSATRST